MPLWSWPSESISNIATEVKLSPEARSRAEAAAESAIYALEKDPHNTIAVQELFRDLVTQNMRNPEQVLAIQEALYAKHEKHMEDIPANQKLWAEQQFTAFMQEFSANLAHMHRDINWLTALNGAEDRYNNKANSLQKTYANLAGNIINPESSETAS